MLPQNTLTISPPATSNSTVRSARIPCPICGHGNCVIDFSTDGQPVDGHCYYSRCSPRAILATLKREKLPPEVFARATAQIDRSIAKAAALKLWNYSQPLEATLGEQYLRARGITIKLPASLRFTANLFHHRDRHNDYYFPALVACAETSDGRFAGINRGWLDPNAPDLKLHADPQKATLGTGAGAVVRLTPRFSSEIALTEGIEDGLSIVQMYGLTTWATLGTNIRAVKLPDAVNSVLIAADNDSAGRRAANEAAEQFYGEGRAVRIVYPRIGKDFNQELLAAR